MKKINQQQNQNKNTQKKTEHILEIAKLNAQVRFLKKKIALSQSKTETVYEIEELNDIIHKLQVASQPYLGNTNVISMVPTNMDQTLCKKNNNNNNSNSNVFVDSNKLTQNTEENHEFNNINNVIGQIITQTDKIKRCVQSNLNKILPRTSVKLKKVEDSVKISTIQINACAEQLQHSFAKCNQVITQTLLFFIFCCLLFFCFFVVFFNLFFFVTVMFFVRV